MDVPPFVPAKPAAPRGPDRPSSAPRYLTATKNGWRFQMRLPTDLFPRDCGLAGPGRIVRYHLGPMPKRDATRLARRLATLCQAVFALASGDHKMQQPDETVADHVISACEAAIGRARRQRSEAIGLAQGLGAALDTLRLVEREVGKGPAGLPAVVENADALTRSALESVLRLAPNPAVSLAALKAATAIAPTPPAPPTAAPITPKGGVPTFGEVSQAYIDMRIANDGAGHPDIKYLQLRRRTFADLIGDRPVDQYGPRDLQAYVSEMQYWPANVTKREESIGLSIKEIIDSNRNLTLKPIARKTLQDGYVANIKTMIRYWMVDYNYKDPFSGAKIRWPKTLASSQPRESISLDVLNRVFAAGAASGQLDEAMLPPLGVLTSRRLGLLLHLRGSDIREKHGVAIAQTSGIVLVDGMWRRVPIKTDASTTFFVLHDFFGDVPPLVEKGVAGVAGF